jgi:hypothetical protein
MGRIGSIQIIPAGGSLARSRKLASRELAPEDVASARNALIAGNFVEGDA